MKNIVLLLAAFSSIISLAHGQDDGPKYYRAAVQAGPFLFVSGQNAQKGDEVLTGDIAQQTTAALDSLEATLKANGYTLANVVNVTVAIAKEQDFPKFNEVYQKYFSHRPARSTALGVLHQDKGALVEITLVAYKEATAPAK